MILGAPTKYRATPFKVSSALIVGELIALEISLATNCMSGLSRAKYSALIQELLKTDARSGPKSGPASGFLSMNSGLVHGVVFA